MRSMPATDPAAPDMADLGVPGLGDGTGPDTAALQVVSSFDLLAHRRLARARAAWPLRRLIAVAVLAPVLLVVAVAASGGWALATSREWTALVVVVASASAMILATYLPRPGTGLRLEVGCTPCAAVAGMSVLASLGLLSSSPGDVPTAVLALGVVAFGLRQRLSNPSTCPA